MLRGASDYGYGTYRTARRGAVERHGVAATLYVMAWFLDYVVTTWPRMFAALLQRRGRLLIIDRYYVDQAVNMSVTLGHDRWIEILTRVFEVLLPAPSHGILLQVSGKVAYSRKDDIKSIEYLEERQELYRAIAERRKFFNVDATKRRTGCSGGLGLVAREGLICWPPRQAKAKRGPLVSREQLRCRRLGFLGQDGDAAGPPWLRPIVVLRLETRVCEIYRARGVQFLVIPW